MRLTGSIFQAFTWATTLAYPDCEVDLELAGEPYLEVYKRGDRRKLAPIPLLPIASNKLKIDSDRYDYVVAEMARAKTSIGAMPPILRPGLHRERKPKRMNRKQVQEALANAP